MTTPGPRSKSQPRPQGERNSRRRGRELALQVLFSLDMAPPESAQAVSAALYRSRERSLIAEAELGFMSNDLERAATATEALLKLDPRHARGREFDKALKKTGPMPLPVGEDEREEHEALAASEEQLAFCDTATRGVMARREAIDALITEVSTNWRIGRMAHVDRNLLRLATWELLEAPETPVRVILNEAIEIAKRFGTQDSRAFINGLLDRLAARVRPGSTDGGARNG